MRTATWQRYLMSFVGLVVVATGAAAQTTGRALPPLAIESLTGRDSFERYCASCHGRDGTGNGPVAGALQTRPADLTSLAQRNGGRFPDAQVRAFIEGTSRPLSAHGTNEMPVWGTTFSALEPSPDGRVRVRLDNLVAYVESLQGRRPANPPATDVRSVGAQLFRTHCATCHGENAQGNGPMASVLRRPPQDLTRFTMQNGGVFPTERLRRVIDGRDVPSHGPGDMPVWGDIFRRTTGDTARAQERIDALLVYLQSIQARAAE
jgi:mono/diheme cytochrome c family protein